MKGSRHNKVTTYAGISEFALFYRYYLKAVDIIAYDIVRPNGWRQKRQSIDMINISKDGLHLRTSYYRQEHLCIDTDSHNNIVVDGVDFT